MAILKVVIEGVSPLLMKSAAGMIPAEDAPTNGSPAPKRKEASIAERLEAACYRLPGGTLGFPGTAIQRLIFDAAKGLKFADEKGKQRKVGAQSDLKGLYRLDPLDLIPVLRDGSPVLEYTRDARTVVNGNTRPPARIPEYRPKIELPWQMEFRVLLDTEFSPIGNLGEQIVALLNRGGRSIGIGSFRPENRGWFGQFRVSEWGMEE